VKGKPKEISDRKVIVTVTLSAEGEMCAKGEGVMVKIPENADKK
jgi:hypothetical protein